MRYGMSWEWLLQRVAAGVVIGLILAVFRMLMY